MIRWIARVTYRTDTGMQPVVWQLEELAELHQLVEQGPHWDTIDSIEIVRAGKIEPLTVEQAAAL